MVCSKWAERLPSAVTTVQSSLSTLVCQPPMLSIGSMAMTMPGCRSYIVAEDPTDPQTIWVTEVWDDEASHKASMQLAAVKAAVAKAMPLIASFGEHRELRVIGGHGLAR